MRRRYQRRHGKQNHILNQIGKYTVFVLPTFLIDGHNCVSNIIPNCEIAID